MSAKPPKTIAERLPGYDRKTRRWEWVIFLVLAKVALAVIVFAVWHAVQFATGKERVVAALSTSAMATAREASSHKTNVAHDKPSAVEPPNPVANSQPDCCAGGSTSCG
jgi:uncharacterized membrane protein